MEEWVGRSVSDDEAESLAGIGIATGAAMGLDMSNPAVVEELLAAEAEYFAELNRARGSEADLDSDDDGAALAAPPHFAPEDADDAQDEAYALYQWHLGQAN